MPSTLKGSKVLSSVSGTEPPLMAADRIRGGGVCSAPQAERDESLFELAGMQDKQKKALRPEPEDLLFRQFKTERLPKQAPEQAPARALLLPHGSTAARSWRERSRR